MKGKDASEELKRLKGWLDVMYPDEPTHDGETPVDVVIRILSRNKPFKGEAKQDE